MSRYRKTMREALEEMQTNEGRMKDIYSMQQDGATAKEIAKKMNLPLSTVKDILGEAFTKKDFDKNEDENEHTKNSYELAKMFGDSSEKSRMTRLYNKTRQVGSFLTKAENDYVTMIQTKYYRKLKEEVEEGFSSDAQRRAAFASGYKAKGKDKKEELDKDDTSVVKQVVAKLKKASKAHADQSKALDKAIKDEVQESVKFKYALVDTSKDNEVVAMSSDEKI